VAAYLIPQVMAYAGVAGLPPVAGLWAILPALGLYALLGSSRLLSVGPESTTALMTVTVVAPLAGSDPDRYAGLAAALAVTVGPLLVVVLGTLAVVLFGLDERHGLKVVGDLRTGLLVYRYDSPLFFANAENFHRRALAAVDDQAGQVRWFVLNTEANVEVDITALDAVDTLRRELAARGIVFALTRVKKDLLDDLEAYGLAGPVGRSLIFPTLPTAVAAYREWSRTHGNPPGDPDGGNSDGSAP
jgi:MFS superfamily sulfate permease-like transporter